MKHFRHPLLRRISTTPLWDHWRRLTLFAGLAMALALLSLVAGPAPKAFAAAFTVNSTGDEGDAAIDGACVSTAATCTLRSALQEAAAVAGPHTISFAITTPASGVRTITVGATALPSITREVTIDGWSQGVADSGTPGYTGPPLIHVAGSATLPQGLSVSDGRATIKGLAFSGFTNGSGIALTATGGSQSIVGSYFGVLPDLTVPNGTLAAQPNAAGILISGSTPNVTIGGTGAGEGNVIAANSGNGVVAAGAQDLKLLGNFIGTDRLGTAGLGNGAADPNGAGVLLTLTARAEIGNTTEAGRNVISGNAGRAGIWLKLADGTLIQGNYIGVGPGGSTAVPNAIGVRLEDALNTTLGSSGAGNVISGNTDDQVLVASTCNCVIPTQTLIRSNVIGPNAGGTAAIPNSANGVRVASGFGIAIGGSKPGEGNLISGNGKDGVSIVGDGSQLIGVGGNWIGLNRAGTAALPNGQDGISLVPRDLTDPTSIGPQLTIIGSEEPSAGNIIAGNVRHGIFAARTRQDTFIYNNRIGTDPTGTIAVGNGRNGVQIQDAQRLVVSGNTIANNGQTGVVMAPHTSAGVFGNLLISNSIYANQGLGIDLAPSVDPNGNGDGKTAPGTAGVQDYPVITTASTSAVGTVIGGTLTGESQSSFSVDRFAWASCEPSLYGVVLVFMCLLEVGFSCAG